MNIVAYFHAYKFTHFTDAAVAKTKDTKHLSVAGKLKALFFGIDNPHPVDSILPSQKFETITLQSNKHLEYWYIRADAPKDLSSCFLWTGKDCFLTYCIRFV
jgi:hypothetical protein